MSCPGIVGHNTWTDCVLSQHMITSKIHKRKCYITLILLHLFFILFKLRLNIKTCVEMVMSTTFCNEQMPSHVHKHCNYRYIRGYRTVIFDKFKIFMGIFFC